MSPSSTSPIIIDDDDDKPHVSDCLIYDREAFAYPSPILAMIHRAKLDKLGQTRRPVDPRDSGRPFKLFSLSSGTVPLTGLPHDRASFDYYDKAPLDPGVPDTPFYFPIGTIQTLQHDLRTTWLSVYPSPIPPLIVRTHDLFEHDLTRRADGSAFVLPFAHDIWSTATDRGIDLTYRPINAHVTVDTDISTVGGGIYYPQDVVASKFAVNVFLERHHLGCQFPICEYLGAYVLQLPIPLEAGVQRPVFECVRGLFKHLYPNCPLSSPFVHFSYYGWDQCLLGLANETYNRIILATGAVPYSRFDASLQT